MTGAAGFIGSNLCAALLSQGHTVCGIDNLSQSGLRNLKPYLAHSQFNFVEDSVSSGNIGSEMISEAILSELGSLVLKSFTLS